MVLELTDDGDGCLVTMHETPIAGPGKWLHSAVTDALLVRRNDESLARLAAPLRAAHRPLTTRPQ